MCLIYHFNDIRGIGKQFRYMRAELRRISAHQEPEIPVADLARPELTFGAESDRLRRVKERHVTEHFAEWRERKTERAYRDG